VAAAGRLLAPLDQETLAHVRAFLEARAALVDGGAAGVRDSLAFLNAELAGTPGAAARPNDDLARVAATVAAAAGCDMTAAFTLWCQRMVLEYISRAPTGSRLQRDVLPRLWRTELLGSTALAAAMSWHVGGPPLPVHWRRDGAELVLDGRISWASNLFPPDFVMVTAAAHPDTGQAVIVAIPGDSPGVEIDGYPHLLALQATGSSSLALRGVRLPEDAVLADDFTAFIAGVRPTFLVLQSSFCWGLAHRALTEARAGLRGVNAVFAGDLGALEARATTLGRFLHERTLDRGSGVPIRQLVQTRLECAQLATAAVALEAKIAGGRGYVRTCGTARRLREAAFLPVQAPTEGQLRWELSRSA
jgi:alkylation response protein AidB-like acyl-CoA dehydrogenase